ncbi:MAG: glycoside hydrolase domain-containing protein [Flavisolibacter sp.]
MKKISIALCLCLCIKASSQLPGQMKFTSIPFPAPHYQEEYHFDTVVHKEAWNKLTPGLHASFATTDQSYFRSEVPSELETNSWEGSAWKGERVNMEILLWSVDSVQQVRLIAADLKNERGNIISKNNYSINLVRYVVSNYPYGARYANCGESPDSSLFLMPDRFEAFDRFDLPGKTVRPVWVSLNIPQEASAGNYRATVEVRSAHSVAQMNIMLHVQNMVLPKPHEWKHRLDIWQNPWAVAWENHLVPWSEEHKALLKKHLKLYADAGGKFITTYAVHSPWSDNSYMIEGGMIEWIKTKNGSWKFDYNIFDQYVQLAMDVGIDKAITLYTPVPWGFRFRYLDEATGNYMYETWSPQSAIYKTVWNAFLSDLKKHLEKKRWLEKTYLGINENVMEETLAAIRVIKEHSPKWRITYAGDWHPQLDSLLNDYCFLFGNESDTTVIRNRSLRGATTTYYVCCNPPFPNNFVFSPPIEGRWMGWYTAAHGYDGFLRWAYDAWPADPMRDARHPFWPAGDCFLVYPGGNSCIRFEKLREGIVDFEKVRIIREKAMHSADPQAHQLLQQLDQHLKIFLTEKEFDTKKITAEVMEGRKLVDQLSELLSSGNATVSKGK